MVAIYFNMCGGLGPWVEYGCPQDGVAFDLGPVCVDVFFWVPRRTIRADVGGGGLFGDAVMGMEGYGSL